MTKSNMNDIKIESKLNEFDKSLEKVSKFLFENKEIFKNLKFYDKKFYKDELSKLHFQIEECWDIGNFDDFDTTNLIVKCNKKNQIVEVIDKTKEFDNKREKRIERK